MDINIIAQAINTSGYVVIRRLNPTLSTEEIAQKFGSIIDVSSILPKVPKVQTLRPRKRSSDLLNQYSGTYGTGKFPLHTDLAHWQLPPRYLMLRCIVGSKDVETTLMPFSTIVSFAGERLLKQALVAPRRKSNTQVICPLPVVFHHNESWGVRWDSLFLSPLNEPARTLSELLTSRTWNDEKVVTEKLIEPGDTIIIDNWRMLHGRSAVTEASMNREIQRIYLSHLGAPR